MLFSCFEGPENGRRLLHFATELPSSCNAGYATSELLRLGANCYGGAKGNAPLGFGLVDATAPDVILSLIDRIVNHDMHEGI